MRGQPFRLTDEDEERRVRTRPDRSDLPSEYETIVTGQGEEYVWSRHGSREQAVVGHNRAAMELL